MHFHIVSLFPWIFESFLQTSLIEKAQNKNIIKFTINNPRDFCNNKHNQIDDEIYGWWHWMLIMAQPMIDCVNDVIRRINTEKTSKKDFLIVNLKPSQTTFDQKLAFNYATNYKHIIIICGRYEWIDHRFSQYFTKKYPNNFVNLSMWKFIVMWWETPAMVLIEAVARLIPGVIWDEESWKQESYTPANNCENIEHPQYTRPQIVEWMEVPKVLLSWHDAKIAEWKEKNSKFLFFTINEKFE